MRYTEGIVKRTEEQLESLYCYINSHLEKWTRKVMHGQFIRQTEDVQENEN